MTSPRLRSCFLLLKDLYIFYVFYTGHRTYVTFACFVLLWDIVKFGWLIKEKELSYVINT